MKYQELTIGKYTLYKGRFGYSISDNENDICYAERNMSETKMFHMLYSRYFANRVKF